MPSPAVLMYGNLTFGLNSYGGCAGTALLTAPNPAPALAQRNGIFYMNSDVRIASIVDGTSNTFMFGERSRLNLPATSTSQALGGYCWVNKYAMEDHTMNTGHGFFEGIKNHDPNDFGSQHSGGSICNFCFADGSVKAIPKSISAVTYQRLSAIADGQVIDVSQY
jgi:prepilin-type processing-associated H-X9-DG protein